ncbi:MAG TPA: helix-turn-helix domain-containing protein [Gemmatimonadaceae bacterium]|nr:helix-turn-helix domain-containing protein [Gemmatimonadaceae bacterium]
MKESQLSTRPLTADALALVPPAPPAPVTPRAPATQRILDAAVRRIVRHGAAALALADIATEAGVSKALIHYHFRDKDSLLARVVEGLADGIIARERGALAADATQHSPLAIDSLWQWLDGELRSGALRVLLELDRYEGEAVRAAAARAAARRRDQAALTVERLFALLDLRPRVPVPLLATVVVTFCDGLALGTPVPGDPAAANQPPARVSFDVFWLAMLNLAE